jgi:integrase
MKGVSVMSQQGQLLRLKRTGWDGEPLWAYRYRTGGRDSKRVQRGGFSSEPDAAEALERELERLRRERRVSRSLTVAELVEVYLAQHDVEQVTIEKLRWLLGKAVAAFGERPVGELRSEEVAAWRIALSRGYRFDATQALRQVLARAVVWGMIDENPAKLGVDNPSPRRREQRPFESWAELDAVAASLLPRYRPMVIFAAATGLRPAEWLALEWRDLDLEARVVYVHRSFTKGRLKCPKTEASRRAVPLQTIALEAIERQSASRQSGLVFPAERGGYLDLHNFRNREWKPAQLAAGIEPLRRIYDLRHTFATFALRAGISTFDLSRYMGASLTMIDRHYGHLARDGREHAIRLLDELSAGERPRWTLVDTAWTPNCPAGVSNDNGNSG